jgi:hypothetical protein
MSEQKFRIGVAIVVKTTRPEFWRDLNGILKDLDPERGEEVELFETRNWGVPLSTNNDPVRVEFNEITKEE